MKTLLSERWHSTLKNIALGPPLCMPRHSRLPLTSPSHHVALLSPRGHQTWDINLSSFVRPGVNPQTLSLSFFFFPLVLQIFLCSADLLSLHRNCLRRWKQRPLFHHPGHWRSCPFLFGVSDCLQPRIALGSCLDTVPLYPGKKGWSCPAGILCRGAVARLEHHHPRDLHGCFRKIAVSA